MEDFTPSYPHTFHIPVMGTGFTIDTPLHVARYGISSVISLVDDVLIEQMRQFHCARATEPYEPITDEHPDFRAARITAYLDLVDRLVAQQVERLKASPFEPGSEITTYFEMLPECSALRHLYEDMCETTSPAEKAERQQQLRERVVPGRIDVNIMAAADRRKYRDGVECEPTTSDASAALRGFAESHVCSALVLSAGMNPRLYGYAASFDGFFPDASGKLPKQIVLKVSDYRSAVIQGKFLAKRGLWVSEFRIESGLNCGGHAFPTQGLLMGPILDEFCRNREKLQAQLAVIYRKALKKAGRLVPDTMPEMRVTVQGGIGTAAEDRFLLEHYGVDGTGWGTPFLLVPEATSVDDEHLKKLVNACSDEEVLLSNSSPFGHPFWNLRYSASEEKRRQRIEQGHPGAPCLRGYCKLFNTEFTSTPICVASREYQKRKLQAMGEETTASQRESVLQKSCICHDLAGGALRKNGIDPEATPAICPGPGIVDFSAVVSLRDMVDHIYGRKSLMTNAERPNMFLRELDLYIEWLEDRLQTDNAPDALQRADDFRTALLEGAEYYRQLGEYLPTQQRAKFLDGLKRRTNRLTSTRTLPAAACSTATASEQSHMVADIDT